MKFGKGMFAVMTGALFVLSISFGVQAQGRSDQALAALENTPHMPNEVLVQFYSGASAQSKARALGRVRGEQLEVVVSEAWRGDRKGELVLAKLPPGIGIAAAVRGLEQDSNVEFAEPNWIYHHAATFDDTYFTSGQLWGMYGDSSTPFNAFGSQAAESWAAGGANCGNVWVGIIDEGYMYTHEDLAANAGKNPGETGGGKENNGIDDDGNGYIDDVYGWDFDRNDNTVFDGGQDDHGTHVAGTIGGVGGNGKGVAGVCWQVNLMGAKFLGRRGGSTANAIKAVDYFNDLKQRHSLNIVATNNSWGGGGFSQSLYDAIERANAAGILFIAAAGNGGSDGVGDDNDTTPHYPSSYSNDNIIAVASITSTGAKSGFSNYGALSVDIGAPGSGIYSTLPDNGYGSYSGTSMATPHVTGAAALYAAANPGATARQIKAAILSAAVSTNSLASNTKTGGRLNVSSFVISGGGGGGGGGGNTPPTASFTSSCIDYTCSFTDASTDSDGTVDTWSWDFGDQSDDPLIQNPFHTYGSAGTYTVTLTVTDNAGASNSTTHSVTVGPPPAIVLTGGGSKSKGIITVNLLWTPIDPSGNVDIYRYDAVVATKVNDGSYSEQLRGSGTVTYKVCVAGSSTSCSDTLPLTF